MPPLRESAPGVVAWVDASAGVAGDMLLAALIDAGASLDSVRAGVDAVLPDAVHLSTREVSRAGMRALKLDVVLAAPDQEQRRWADIRDLITAAALPQGTIRRALATFEALARAEAQVHGVAIDDVHFHEVGAWDSVADVVGACAALEELGASELVVSVVGVGSGSVHGAHGRVPVPVPAVLELTRGWVVDAVGDGELATPTGVALVTTLATRQGPLPRMELRAVGVGAGTKDITDRANVVRVVLGAPLPVRRGEHSGAMAPEAVGPGGPSTSAGLLIEDLVVLEANVDDLDPRVWPSVLSSLLSAGAGDAWLTPILMKKGRPAHTLSVLARRQDSGALRDLVLAETSTIGVREKTVVRWALPRSWVDVDVEGQRLAVKVAHRDGRIVHATPEFGDIEVAAEQLRRPVRDVLEAAIAAAARAGLVPGAPLPSASRPAASRPAASPSGVSPPSRDEPQHAE